MEFLQLVNLLLNYFSTKVSTYVIYYRYHYYKDYLRKKYKLSCKINYL